MTVGAGGADRAEKTRKSLLSREKERQLLDPDAVEILVSAVEPFYEPIVVVRDQSPMPVEQFGKSKKKQKKPAVVCRCSLVCVCGLRDTAVLGGGSPENTAQHAQPRSTATKVYYLKNYLAAAATAQARAQQCRRRKEQLPHNADFLTVFHEARVWRESSAKASEITKTPADASDEDVGKPPLKKMKAPKKKAAAKRSMKSSKQTAEDDEDEDLVGTTLDINAGHFLQGVLAGVYGEGRSSSTAESLAGVAGDVTVSVVQRPKRKSPEQHITNGTTASKKRKSPEDVAGSSSGGVLKTTRLQDLLPGSKEMEEIFFGRVFFGNCSI